MFSVDTAALSSGLIFRLIPQGSVALRAPAVLTGGTRSGGAEKGGRLLQGGKGCIYPSSILVREEHVF